MILPELYTPRLQLRPIAAADAEALFPLFSDAEAMRYWSCPPFADIEALRAWLAPDDAFPAWAVLLGGNVVGRVMLVESRPGVAEVGYAVLPESWGRGIGREALGAVLDHCFGAGGLRRVFADIDPDNAASVRLVKALGFTLEGHLRAEWETHHGVRDSLIYGLLAPEWRQERSAELMRRSPPRRSARHSR